MNIRTRLILALSTLALVLVLGIVLLFQWRFDAGLLDYVNDQQRVRLEIFALELGERWREDPGWTELLADRQQFYRMLRRPPEHGRNRDRDDHDDDDARPPPPPKHARSHGGPPDGPPPLPVVLLDAKRQVLVGRSAMTGEFAIEVPVLFDTEIVGYLGTPRFARLEHDIDRHFREAQIHTLWLVSGLALALAILFAILLARQFTRPLLQLSQAAHRLTQQQYAIEVDDRRRDELGALGRDISELARTLARNADARQRWFADISHELRTPLAVLAGEIDAILDGVRPLTRERIESLQQEVLHLQRLVDDLYTLARADLGALQYRKTAVDLAALVDERIEMARPAFTRAQLAVTAELPATTLMVTADEDRLQQLIDNLLANSQRYTDAGGSVRIAVALRDQDAELIIEDSAPGVPIPALAKLFDHLYRVDEARSRATGGAGLGLAICKRIVEAHAGRIEATPSPLGGLRIRVLLPLAETAP